MALCKSNIKPKGRNPIAVDNWLDSLGLYRKNVAHDETCLFRAVSEHLFQCQIYHERVRKECVQYGRENFFEFCDILAYDEFYDHMDLLEKHMVICGNLEILILSSLYQCDIIVYDSNCQEKLNMTNRNYATTLSLCLLNGDHFDVVFKKDHIKNAGFCQSIVYTILYEGVFEISDVQEVVKDMLYDKKYTASFSEVNNNNNIAPFTFKVAKALDPTMYRNIEFDCWSRMRREMRLGDWYHGDDNLILGTKCLYNQLNDTFECYIQRMIEKDKCEVYIVKLATRRIVNYTDLSPEDDAKPWPLPYRFCKSTSVATPPSPTQEKNLKITKKRKDKRKMRHNETHSSCDKQELEAFIGAPLQMKNGAPDAAMDAPKPSTSQHNLLVTPDAAPDLRISWEVPWNSYNAVGKNEWPLDDYNKQVVTSTPITPNVIPYYDDQFMYNCPVANYNPMVTWSSYDNTPQPSVELDADDDSLAPLEPSFSEPAEPQAAFKEKLTLCTTMPQTPPVFHLPPGTPIYTPQGIVNLQVYTPPIDVQYMSPRPVMYLPTPPAQWYPTGVNPQTWYPPGVNAQGFIFQAAANPNSQN